MSNNIEISSNETLKHLVLLILTFVVGIIILVSLHTFFIKLNEDLDKKTNNLKAKIEIGEFIINDIDKIKSDFYELATTVTNKNSLEMIKKRVYERINFLEKCLKVLDKGGKVTRVIKLNIEGHYNSEKTIQYIKKDHNVSLEVIELAPKLKELKQMLEKMTELLIQQIKYRKNNDIENFLLQNRAIKRFYKNTPSVFIRISENANRLLYEGSIQLEKIEKELSNQKDYYTKLEFFLIILFIFLAVVLGITIASNINKNTQQLQRQEQFTRGTLDSQKNIVIVSNGENMIDANKALIDFFNEFNSFDEFKEKHLCICDFFENIENLNDDFIITRYKDDILWFEYIIKNPQIKHKVVMKKQNQYHYFSITANKKQLDEQNTIVIVTLNNITEEMKTQKELKALNENLESLIEEKTIALKRLNEHLEDKIKREVENNREKDKALIQQSRFAALGEMLGNIAHQWRQPLSAIMTTVTSMQIQRDLKISTSEDVDKSYEAIKKYVNFLNQTINDFRGFFAQDKEKSEFNVLDVINNSSSITKAIYKNHNIDLIYDIKNKDLKVLGFPNELSQVILNILSNAKDIFLSRNTKDRIVKIELYENSKFIIIEITDSAEGIDKDILLKVFDPYFTTKHKSQGTGIGLYMSKYIVEKNLGGILSVQNKEFIHMNRIYLGACFKIELPKF